MNSQWIVNRCWLYNKCFKSNVIDYSKFKSIFSEEIKERVQSIIKWKLLLILELQMYLATH